MSKVLNVRNAGGTRRAIIDIRTPALNGSNQYDYTDEFQIKLTGTEFAIAHKSSGTSASTSSMYFLKASTLELRGYPADGNITSITHGVNASNMNTYKLRYENLDGQPKVRFSVNGGTEQITNLTNAAGWNIGILFSAASSVRSAHFGYFSRTDAINPAFNRKYDATVWEAGTYGPMVLPETTSNADDGILDGTDWYGDGSDYIDSVVTPTPIAFTGTIPAQTGSVNTPFNLNFASYFTGNRTPFSYVLASGSLPAGLSLSGSTITGTPSATSTGLTFSIRGTDADGATATSNVVGITINAAPIPVSFSGTIPQLSGVKNSAINRNVASYFTGSETPFTYAIASGSLPTGVTLSGSTITGTPTVSGTFNVSIRATDTKSNVATSNSFAIVISDAPIAIGFSGSIPAQTGTLNTAFSLNLSSYFTGNLTPFTFSVVNGSLPAGLSINGDVISGTPTTVGSGSFTIRGTDTANNTATSNAVSFTINSAPIPVGFSGSINPINAAVNVPVNVDVSSNFTGNLKPFTYSIASGGLPNGLSLNGSVISGTPTLVATTSVTIRATDSQGNTALSNSISVNVAASVTPVTFTGTIGSLSGTKGLPLNSTNITGYFWGSLTPFIYNIQSGVLPNGVVLNNGVLQGTPTITGTFPITVRATDTGSNVATSNEFSLVISEPAAGTTIISRSNMTPTTVTISANYSGTDNSGFEYSLSNGPWVAVPVSPFTVEGLTEYTSYTLVVRPKVATNDGLVSNTLTFKTYRGVLASQVPSTGVSGPSCIYNDITKHNTLQNDYVYCNYLTEPVGGNGVFTPKPDGSFSWVGAADGVYTFTYQYEVNNVEIGPVKNVKLIIG